ncbi:hypothetical protein EUGRSUZ_E04212 [Eucalyptus grandis]|uniref:Uncharacterized protein n=2 Tax=Eucalyptus grandis TaxID=71139 RepID=A0ACC3L1Y9_EUCGR|nr:hypothetical protein EUGRSUZ_E04212 [Eucalyptus grandis]
MLLEIVFRISFRHFKKTLGNQFKNRTRSHNPSVNSDPDNCNDIGTHFKLLPTDPPSPFLRSLETLNHKPRIQLNKQSNDVHTSEPVFGRER